MNAISNELSLPQETGLDRATRAAPVAVWLGALLLGSVVFANSFNVALTMLPEGAEFTVDRNVILRMAICAACGLYGLCHLSRTAGPLCRFPGAWTVLFGLWCLVTVPFSANLTYVLGACAALWCMILFAPAVLLQLGGRRTALVILAALLVYLVGSWILYFTMPELGRYGSESADADGMVRVGGDANQLGLQATWAIGMLLMLGDARCLRRRVVLPMLAFAVVTLYFTQARTAMVAASAVVALWGVRKLNLATAMILGCFTCVLGALWLGWAGFDLDRTLTAVSRSGDAEEVYNLTGRTEIWKYALERIHQSPLVGYGFGASRYALAYFENSGYGYNDLHHAHNQVLNIVLCTGVIGGLLVVAMLLGQLYLLVRRPSAFPDIVTIVVLVAGLTEVVVFGPMPRSSTLIWLIAMFWRQLDASLEVEPAPGTSSEL